MSENPYVTPGSPADVARVADAVSPNWTYVVALLLMGFGAIYTITCIGALYGVPFLFVGLSLWRAADAATSWRVSGSTDDAARSAAQFVRALRIYGMFVAIVFAVTAVLVALLTMMGGILAAVDS